MRLLELFRKRPEQDAQRLRALRDEVYRAVFGVPLAIGVDDSKEFPLDFYQFAPGIEGRDYFTVVTSGMSDKPIPVPDSEAGRRSRFELVVYTTVVSPELRRYLRFVAFFPHVMERHVDHGFTIRFDDGRLLLGSDKIATVLVDALFDTEMTVPKRLVIGGDPVHLLLPIPLTALECDYVVAHGVEKFFDGPLNDSGFDLMFNPQRASSI